MQGLQRLDSSSPLVKPSRLKSRADAVAFQADAVSSCEHGRDSLHAVGFVDVRMPLEDALAVLMPMWTGDTTAALMRDVDRTTSTPLGTILESTVSIGPITVNNKLHFRTTAGPHEMRYSLVEPSFPIKTIEQRSFVEVINDGNAGSCGSVEAARGPPHLRITSDQRFGLYKGWGSWVPGFGRLLGAMCAYKMRRAVEDMATALHAANSRPSAPRSPR